MGEVGHLHDNYNDVVDDWFHLGRKISVPSLRVEKIRLLCRQPVEITANQLEKLIQTIAPDNEPRQFWRRHAKSSELVAVGNVMAANTEKIQMQHTLDAEFRELKKVENFTITGRKDPHSKKRRYPSELLNLFKEKELFNPAESGPCGVIVSRNFVHWKACISPEVILDSLLCIPEGITWVL